MKLFFSLDLVMIALLNILFMYGALFDLTVLVFIGACLFRVSLNVDSKLS